jgi:hypothetical protein
MFSRFRKPQKKSDTTSFSVQVIANGAVSETTVEFYTLYSDRFRKGGYFISGIFPEIGTVSTSGPSLFEALFRLRESIESNGQKLAVWGAKRSVWPSGMQADMGGGFMASDRESESHECKGVLDAIPISEAVTTKEQRNWNDKWKDSQYNKSLNTDASDVGAG